MAEESENREKAELAAPRGWNLIRLDALKSPPIGLAASVYVLGTLIALSALALIVYGFGASFQLAQKSITGNIDAAKVFFPILLALVGGPLLIWRVIAVHIQSVAARRQAEVAQQGFYTSLFTKAVKQLGATREEKSSKDVDDGAGGKKCETVTETKPNLEVRLGAIYALDRLARGSEPDHWPIMEVLCAYVRNAQNTGPSVPWQELVKRESDGFRDWRRSLQRTPVEIQAAISVIGARPEQRRALEATKGLRLDLRGANLQRAVFAGGHFERAIFRAAVLDGAWFDGAELAGAWFDWAELRFASFGGAQLVGASFGDAQLAGAQFKGARLDGASFTGAQLASARFSGAKLAGARFSGAQLAGTIFDEAEFAGARLFNADLSQVMGLDTDALATALGDASTRLPADVARPTTWPEFSVLRLV